MTRAILALNVGSSSIKFSLFAIPGPDQPLSALYRGEVENLGAEPRFWVRDVSGRPVLDERPQTSGPGPLDHERVLGLLLQWIERHEAGLTLVAVGHRIVHGGPYYTAPVLVDAAVMHQLEQLIPLAPLHQPHNLAGIRAMAAHRPDLPEIACFDTAFHTTEQPTAQAFALPLELTDTDMDTGAVPSIRRYGFHGLSYEYIAHILPTYLGTAADGRVVVAHLGNGASMCAMRGRRSVATTMGLTALDGLPMGTRCGSLDPGVILYLIGERGMDVSAVTDLLYRRSGLLGVSGLTGDVRELLRSDSPRVAAALNLFVYRIGRELGSLAAALGGLDAVVFTAGIGEHAVPIRARVCQDAVWLGVRLDESANQANGPRISTDDSAVSVWVIPTDEDWMIAQHCRRFIT